MSWDGSVKRTMGGKHSWFLIIKKLVGEKDGFWTHFFSKTLLKVQEVKFNKDLCISFLIDRNGARGELVENLVQGWEECGRI